MKRLHPILLLLTVFVPYCAAAQEATPIGFGCGEQRTQFDDSPKLKFEPLTDPQAIRQWQSRPVLKFKGFDAPRYGFTEVRFYRWHVPVPGREGNEQSGHRDSSQRLDLAIELITPPGPRWFRFEHTKELATNDLLYIQPDAGDTPAEASDSSETSQLPAVAKPQDEMEAWLSLKLASPNASLPLFLLGFAYNDSGANAGGTIDNQLLIDFLNGVPRVIKTAQCILWEGGGVCGAPDTANVVWDQLTCAWDPTAEDFHCAMVGSYGNEYSPLSSQRDFYLLSGKPAKPAWSGPDVAPDLAALALRLRGNPKIPSEPQTVLGVGPAVLAAHDTGLIPGTEVFVFASAAPSAKIASRFTLVTIGADGQPAVQPISKWDIGGDKSDEVELVVAATPLRVEHKYRVRQLESRPGFRALEVTLAVPQQQVDPVHVVYWVGLEAVNGSLASNSVRLASEGTVYGSCNQFIPDGTATSITRKPNLAEANLRIQPQQASANQDDSSALCAWTGSLHWKPGSGFRVRKLTDLCQSPDRDVKITDDGALTSKPRPKDNAQ
jgi:hypothetical protein